MMRTIHSKHRLCTVNKKNSQIVCGLFFLLYALKWITFFFLLHVITGHNMDDNPFI